MGATERIGDVDRSDDRGLLSFRPLPSDRQHRRCFASLFRPHARAGEDPLVRWSSWRVPFGWEAPRMTPPIVMTSGACRQAGRHLPEGEEVKQYSDPGKRILPVHGTFVRR